MALTLIPSKEILLENFPELVLDSKPFWVKPEVFNGPTIIYGVVLLVDKSLDSILSSLINKLNTTKYPKNFWEKKGCLVEGAELIFGDIQKMILGNNGLFIAEIYFKDDVIDGRSSAIILQGQISDLIKVGTFINRFIKNDHGSSSTDTKKKEDDFFAVPKKLLNKFDSLRSSTKKKFDFFLLEPEDPERRLSFKNSLKKVVGWVLKEYVSLTDERIIKDFGCSLKEDFDNFFNKAKSKAKSNPAEKNGHIFCEVLSEIQLLCGIARFLSYEKSEMNLCPLWKNYLAIHNLPDTFLTTFEGALEFLDFTEKTLKNKNGKWFDEGDIKEWFFYHIFDEGRAKLTYFLLSDWDININIPNKETSTFKSRFEDIRNLLMRPASVFLAKEMLECKL